ncbi:MAG: SiaB family protein kinase [Bacteroidales bacterium]|nr:SiaB family protein kinase [Bacteroidales bacterium]
MSLINVSVVSNSILSHTGLLSFSTIDALLTKFNMVSQDHNINFTLYKRVIAVMIEALENVYKYKDEYEQLVDEKQDYVPTFEISMNSEYLRMTTTNPVRNGDIDKLKMNIDHVNNKSREELRKLYLSTITNGKFSSKGGAGLGFIEMAKTSGNDLVYSFQPITDKYSLYTFMVTFAL